MVVGNNVFEYVASGPSFMNLTVPVARDDDEFREDLTGWFDLLTGIDPNFKFSVLFNAFTETDKYIQLYRDSYNKLYSDSGGLQMFTRGMTNDAKSREGVYEVQSNTDFGMSFDVLPVKSGQSENKRGQFNSRWVDKENFADCARQSGTYLNDQMNYFRNAKSKCKPIFIIHGSCYEEYLQWIEHSLKEVSDENKKNLDTIAISAAANGNGDLEEISLFFHAMHLPISQQVKHIHFLGFGSIRRLVPLMSMIFNGTYQNLHISFDSTTHTMGPYFAYGFYHGKMERFHKVNKNHMEQYEKMYAEINKLKPLPMSFQEFVDVMNMAKQEGTAASNGRTLGYIARNGIMFSSIYHFITYMKSMLEQGTIGHEHNNHAIWNTLVDVKTPDDFKHWRNEIGYMLDSNAVRHIEASSLSGFFDEE